MRVALALVAVAAVSAPASAAPALGSRVSTHPGIVHEMWEDLAMPARIHIVQIDLTSQEVGLYATKEGDRGITTTGQAARLDAQVAINGDAFAVAGYRPRGLAIGDGAAWSNTADDPGSSVFHYRRLGERTVAAIVTPEVVTTLADLPADTQGAISGRPLLIRAGGIETNFPNDPITIAYQRAPRSAIALSEDGNTMWLVTVDGWQAGSIGMTAGELATFLRTTKNPYMAMALDGGGSSTLVLDGAVTNSPSDGVARTVANHLSVKFGALPRGQLIGLICRATVVGCGNNPAQQLPGAEVTLDDGRVMVVGSDAFYDFPNITPRLACVTARKAGFKTKTKCKDVPSGDMEFNSIPLEEGLDPPDAGVSDGSVPEDAADGADGGLRPDGGNPGIGDGGGCCDSGHDQPASPTLPILVASVGFMLLRRRGTTAPT